MTISPIIFRTPWDFKLPQRPNKLESFSEVEQEMARLYNSLQQMQLALAIVGNSLEVIFSEAVTFGALVNLYGNAGVLNARNANSGVAGTSGAVQPCHGFCNSISGVASGKTGFVQFGGSVILGLTGLTIGSNYWLKATNGQMQNTPDITAGHIEQYIGVAVDTSKLSFSRSPWIQH